MSTATAYTCHRCKRRLRRDKAGRTHWVTTSAPLHDPDQPKIRRYCWPGEGCARWTRGGAR